MEIDPIDYSDELILIVDDEKDVAYTLKELLWHTGLNANAAEGAESALVELKRNEAYTFIVTDMAMPGMDGMELIQKVKSTYPEICIIAMTGFSNDYTYIDVINSGATDFINKPFPIAELEAKIRRGIIERNTKKELESLSITDALTGLYNQRHFFAQLKKEVLRAQRQKQQLSLIFFDLDNFKYYNDKYGHIAGDEVLKKFGEIINSEIRQSVDTGYRYGGDEFAVILIDADLDSCKRIGNRISDNFIAEYGISVSMGSAFLSYGMTPESLLEEADKDLYKTKKRKIALRASNV